MIGKVALTRSKEDFAALAQAELRNILGINAMPAETTVKLWPKAIPQYDKDYAKSLTAIESEKRNLPGVFLVANYLGGISLNDCVQNAKLEVNKSLNYV